jgi:hypothetical protein
MDALTGAAPRAARAALPLTVSDVSVKQ